MPSHDTIGLNLPTVSLNLVAAVAIASYIAASANRTSNLSTTFGEINLGGVVEYQIHHLEGIYTAISKLMTQLYFLGILVSQ